jgi:hypothetical protein
VHQVSYIDFWRAPQTLQPQPREANLGDLVQIQSD